MAEIAPGVHRIDGLKGGRTNAYLLVDGDTLALIDTGLPGSLNPIVRYVKSIGKRLEQLRYVLLTHAHPDHAGGAPALRQRTGAAVLAHSGDVRSNGSRQSVSYMGMFGALPLPLPFLRRVPADGVLSDGDLLPLLGGLQVVHTPGHTPGSLCYYMESIGLLFTGDLLIESRGALWKNRHAFPGANLRDYQASLARVASLPFDALCPGHGDPVTTNASARVRSLADEHWRSGLSWRLFGGG